MAERESFSDERPSRSDSDAEIGLTPLSHKSAEEPLLAEADRSPFDMPPSRRQNLRRRLCIALPVVLTLLCLGLLAAIAVSDAVPHPKIFEKRRWNVKNFKSMITFGDSYTDEGRYHYFFQHNKTYPPAGTFFRSSRGSRNWARYVVQYTGSSNAEQWEPQMTLYNYAFGGSWCADEVIARKPRTHQS